MHSARSSIALFFFSVVVFAFFFFLPHNTKQAFSVATHVVISEIQIAGTTANDEFVELYNPTETSVDITGWRLTRKTQAGTTENNLVASLSGTIAAQGYFLIAHPSYDGLTTPDRVYSATSSAIAVNNSVILYSDAGVTTVDMVGLGTAVFSETTGVNNPVSDGSVERKAQSSSTNLSMDIGGIDELAGNGEDSDHNALDFIARSNAQPQNSSSPVEPISSPTITPTQSPTPTESPTPTPSEEPTPTLTPTDEPTTPTPTESETPTITPTTSLTPTPSAAETPTPTLLTPTETPTPTLSPTPTSIKNPTITLKGLLFSCSLEYMPIKIFGFTFRMPKIQCATNT